MNTLVSRLWKSFQDKEYRQIYAEGFSDSKIATQIKVLREQRGWTQAQLAETAGMKQSRIAALEDVNYSSWSIRTLRRLAQAFDLWLDVEFKEFSAVWPQLRDFSQESLTKHSFTDDPIFNGNDMRQTQATQVEIVQMTNISIDILQQRPVSSVLESAMPLLNIGQEMKNQGSPGSLLAMKLTQQEQKNYEPKVPNRQRGAYSTIA